MKSITKAAETLYLTQPAVSIQLRNFQDQFEIPLTEVIGRQLYITPFGQEVAEASKRILDEVELLKYKSLAHKGQLAGPLHIAVVSTGKYVMPFFLSTFLKENDGIELEMEVTNRAQVLSALEKNEVDFALVSVLPDNLHVERISLMDNKLLLVGHPDSAKTIASGDKNVLNDIPWIYREPGSATRQAMERFISTKNIEVRKKMVLTSNEAVKQAILAGMGVSVMPLIGIKNELQDKNIEIIKTKGLPITTSWNLIWPKGKKFTPAAKAYFDYINSSKEEIISKNFQWLKAY